jgi:hypothetical protein
MLDSGQSAELDSQFFHGLRSFVPNANDKGIGEGIGGQGLDHVAQAGTGLHARQGFLAGNELKLFDAGLMLQARANIVPPSARSAYRP